MSLIRIKEGLFKAFKNPINLDIGTTERWVVVGPKKQALLEIVAGKHTPEPPTAISYPSLGHDHWPSQVIAHVIFGETGSKAPYLSARYESFRDEFDHSLSTVLAQKCPDPAKVQRVMDLLHLKGLGDRWFVSLSNGQTRRAHLATALLTEPKALVIDEPFLGLDPANRSLMDGILKDMPIPIVIGAQSKDGIPSWATHIAVADSDGVVSGRIGQVEYIEPDHTNRTPRDKAAIAQNPPAIELKGITVAYRGEEVLSDLNLVVNEGERLHIKGPNGSGKSTLVALLTADHPQSWNERVVLFGEPRQVGKQDYFSINSEIGHSSPEIHAIFPKHRTLRQAIGTAFADAFVPVNLSAEQNAKLEDLARRLNLNLDTKFGEASLADQKLALLARAIVKQPRILILDEAFSTLNHAQIETAFDLLDEYKGTTLVIGHVASEIPPCDNVLDLGEGL